MAEISLDPVESLLTSTLSNLYAQMAHHGVVYTYIGMNALGSCTYIWMKIKGKCNKCFYLLCPFCGILSRLKTTHATPNLQHEETDIK